MTNLLVNDRVLVKLAGYSRFGEIGTVVFIYEGDDVKFNSIQVEMNDGERIDFYEKDLRRIAAIN